VYKFGPMSLLAQWHLVEETSYNVNTSFKYRSVNECNRSVSIWEQTEY